MDRLISTTRKSRLQWTRSGEESYLTSITGYSVTVSSEDGDGHPPYRLSILDEKSIEIAAVDWQVDKTTYGSVISGGLNDYLRDLYRAVRASVVDARGAVEKI